MTIIGLKKAEQGEKTRMEDNLKIKEIVKEKYGAIALQTDKKTCMFLLLWR